MTPERKNVKDLVEVRKGLHFAAVFLNTVSDVTRGKRDETQEDLLLTAVDNVQELRYGYDQAFKKARKEAGL